MKKLTLRDAGFYALIIVILISTIIILRQTDKANDLIYSEVRDLFERKQVERFTVDGKTLTLTLSEPINGTYTFTYKLASLDIFYNDLHDLIDEQHEQGIIVEYDYP
ncbi:MAG: ATP-dependent metallopeptidase FtsH/Yme1/Tma family protein, partial [Oscillospiraceae bacterium]|nr:ATP-dependent metallopeptidase FtsH/Yme1/Tma family protein [Oscillospiraceae bacterium]